MLINDIVTIACEVPVWLWEKNLDAGIFGHIDILQVRNDQVYILDYKPDAAHEVEQKVASRLYSTRRGYLSEPRSPWRNSAVPGSTIRCIMNLNHGVPG